MPHPRESAADGGLTVRPWSGLVGDKATLWEFVDWMMSPGSNSAAGPVMREARLLRQYGTACAVPETEFKRFFSQKVKSELTALFETALFEPIARDGLALEQLRRAVS